MTPVSFCHSSQPSGTQRPSCATQSPYLSISHEHPVRSPQLSLPFLHFSSCTVTQCPISTLTLSSSLATKPKASYPCNLDLSLHQLLLSPLQTSISMPAMAATALALHLLTPFQHCPIPPPHPRPLAMASPPDNPHAAPLRP